MSLCDVNIFSNLMKMYFTHTVSTGGWHMLHVIFIYFLTCFNSAGKGEDRDSGGVIMRH